MQLTIDVHDFLVEELDIPLITNSQLIHFAILCAQQVGNNDIDWCLWANDWLYHIDRLSHTAGWALCRWSDRYPNSTWLEPSHAEYYAMVAAHLDSVRGPDIYAASPAVRDSVNWAVVTAAYSDKLDLKAIAKQVFAGEESKQCN